MMEDQQTDSPSEPSVATPDRRMPSRWVLAAAALLLVVAVAGVLVLRGGNDDTPEPKVTTNSTSPATDAAAGLVEQGLAAQGAGRLDEARGLYQKAIDQDPTNKLAYYNLGVIYQQLNAVNDARAAYRHALQIDAKYQPALFNLAVLETPVNRTEAVSLYQQILAINPNDANVHLNLGLLLKQMGRNSEGDAELAKALQLDPGLASRIPGK